MPWGHPDRYRSRLRLRIVAHPGFRMVNEDDRGRGAL